ncbi:MAG TPA: UPF0262 family protein [Beijerinckiaceae bacterium]|nr:UPF0262 family protein [Beijerinckiaceae bacterium]
MSDDDPRKRLYSVVLDETSIERGTPDQEHERQVAIYDLIEENYFALAHDDGGPYALHLGLVSNRLVFDIRREQGDTVVVHVLSLTPLKKIVKDYFLICDSYYEAIRNATADRIEAIDMARRGVHNEGSAIVRERLEGKIELDHQTARRLFTLISALSWTGREA